MTNPFGFGPIRYADVQPLNHRTHGGLAVRADARAALSARLRAAPLLVAEIACAALDYPVVFTAGESITPVALFSPGADGNPHAPEGRWLPGRYVPASVRRYPFILGAPNEAGERALCVDAAALEPVDAQDPRRLFDAAEPGKTVRQALNFCRGFQAQLDETVTFGEVITAAGLLTGRRGAGLPSHRAVDPEALAALPGAVVEELHRGGILAAIHAHLVSLGHLDRTARRADQGANGPKTA